MAKTTVAFGGLLILLGAIGYIGTGMEHPTALIPAFVGIILCGAGVFANTEDTKKRMLWMHIAVTVGLLGFLASAGRAGMVLAKGGSATAPGTLANLAMALICAAFVALCVKSFIAARRGRLAEA